MDYIGLGVLIFFCAVSLCGILFTVCMLIQEWRHGILSRLIEESPEAEAEEYSEQGQEDD